MGGSDDGGTVSVDAIPDPVAGYGFPDDQAVVVATNEAFDAEYGASVGTPVRRWLRNDVGADETTVEKICSSLAHDGEFDGELGARQASGERYAGTSSYFHALDMADGPDDVEGYVLMRSRSGDGVEVNRIASVISHDLRNPLDVANAHLQAARETGAEEHSDHLRESHDRMERIIQDVLTLARGENALRVTENVDIADVAADAWETVDTEAASLTLAEDLSTTRADTDRLQRLFENLFRNSVDHAQPAETGMGVTDDGGNDHTGEQLHIWVGTTGQGFFVADDGGGIPPEEHSQVFDPGYSSSGTGLGLTIVRQIAEAHDWSVSVTTGSRAGARFEFQCQSPEESVSATSR